jgi:SanA protein
VPLTRRVLRFGVFAMLALAGLVLAILLLGRMAQAGGEAWADAYVKRDVDALPTVDAVLVLGTSPYGRRGQRFRTLSWRLNAAFEVWSAGKARTLIVSGNRIGRSYDEAASMRDGLVALGVPAEFIQMDPRGVRTWDQVLHARTLFGQQRLIIVSQRDHLGRALFIARHEGIEAWGFAAEGRSYIGLRGTVIGDLSMLRAYYDVVAGSPVRAGLPPVTTPVTTGAGPAVSSRRE